MVTRRALLVLLLSASLLLVAGASTPPSPAGEQDEIEGRAPTPEELRPSVEAAFADESNRPGSIASLRIFNRASGIRMQLFRIGADAEPTRGRSEMQGVPVTEVTWQAYNLRDDDGDGQGDSWYASWRIHTARLARPFLNRGVPYNFRSYDLPFLEWLDRTGKQVDVLSQADLEATSSARALARAYRLIVFPGHHEYVTTREYDRIKGYRNLGGHLMFLSADNFCWRVVRHGRAIEKTRLWRDLGRPEAALIGVQYRGNDRGTHRGAWILRHARAESWAFAGTSLGPGDGLSNGGIEIDKTSPASPKGIQVLAEIPNLFGPGFTGQMTYYERPSGAEVFAAGAFTLAGAVREPKVATLIENVWTHMTE